FSQNSAPVVDNVTFSQRTDSSFIVDVYYDLDGNTMSVLMLVSADYGSTWNFSCDSISGAIGCNILSGYGKHIVWDFGAEHPGTNGNKFRVKIYADDRNKEKGKVTDIDGNIYITTKIGDQWWMAENLKVTHYNNGDSISNVTDNSEWGGLTTGAYCNYNNDSTRVSKYGRLYNWYAVDDSRGIAPAGWHVPTDEDWKELEMFLGMSQSDADIAGYRGTDEGGKLKETGTIHWNSPNTGATNSSGFTTLPGGYRYYVGAFSYMGVHCLLWSSDEGSSTYAWSRELDYGRSGVGRFYDPERNGFSVRCVRD
ncbi:MAG: fibrobacter succinogenes major paralogous domain-containing protein, partial [Anaerolineaceae bacterium]|nr:fibrobacter succinogenes major paralogous domain-containing protein [Anaerolineaceae bacterium]